MTYLLQVSTCWIVFYGIYLLFLRKETFFNINRYYLLGALLTGLLVPYLGSFIPANEASVEVYQVMTQFSAAEVTPQAYVEDVTPLFTWINLLWAVYILGGIVVLSRFIFGLNRIYSIYKEADKTPQTKYTLVESNKYHLPFSFFHYIFISKQLPLNDEVEKVLRHEELHANQWHSIDIVFTELLQIFFWFNPILIMYKGALRQSHEYLADAYVTQDHNKNSYGQLLLQQSASGLEIALANQFFHSQIKKRITMMYKEKSKRSAMVKYLVAVPVLVAMLIIFSSNQMKVQETEENFIELEEVNSSFENEINENNTPPFIRFGYERGSTDPLILIDGEIVNQVNYPKTDYKCESMTHYSLDKAIEQFGEKGKFGVVNFEGLEFIESADREIGNFDGRKITQRNWSSFHNKYRTIEGTISIKAEANAIGDIVYVEIINDKTTIKNKVVLKDALRTVKTFKIEKGDKKAIGEISLKLGKRIPQQGFIYHENIDVFRFDKEINLGEQVPKGSLEVRIEGELLKEGEDYKVDYIKGKLIMSNSYDNELPVDVTFKEKEGDPIFKVVEEMPRFPGCEDMKGTVNEKEECAKQKMLEFVYSNLKYPSKARDAGVEGMCVVQFIIEKDGTVTEAKIVRDIGADCGVETKKVINNFPIWIPGKQKGKTVRVMYTLPVKFKLEGDTKNQEDAKIVAFGEANQKIKEENLIIDKKTEKKEDIFKVVQEMPRFSGCEDMEGTAKEKEECAKGKMLEYIYTNIRYPIEAKTKGIDGMSVISLVIEKDGAVTNVGTLRDPGLGTGAEAARIVRGMPKWIPGKQNGKTVRVQYTLPVKFKLEKEINEMPSKLEKLLKGKTAGISIIVDSERKIRLTSTNHNGPDPLYVVDGKIQKITSIESESINPDDIESINVLKGEKATEKYGDKGKNGVIEITMKSDGLNKDYTYKTSLKYTVNQFKEVKDIAHLLRDVGLKAESKAEILHFRIVRIQEREDAEPLYSDDGTFNQNVKDLIAKTKMNDRYFFEDITVKIDGKEENIGALSIMIVDGMPSLVNSLVVVNGKIETSDWMNNINPEDIAKMDILNGEKMIEKYGDIPHNSVVEVTLKSDKRVTKNLYESKSNKLNTIKFSANPNPSDGNFNVIYQLEKNIPVNLTFYSIEGKTIKRMLNLPAENNINIDLSNHNLPLIYITLEQDGKTKTIKATFQK